jgi:hypothetical protein
MIMNDLNLSVPLWFGFVRTRSTPEQNKAQGLQRLTCSFSNIKGFCIFEDRARPNGRCLDERRRICSGFFAGKSRQILLEIEFCIESPKVKQNKN